MVLAIEAKSFDTAPMTIFSYNKEEQKNPAFGRA